MSTPIEIAGAAQLEFDEAADYYTAQNPEIEPRFVASIDKALSEIAANPKAFPVVHGTHVRRAIVHDFPFVIFYTIRPADIFIYSIFHTSRNPMIWRGRIG